MVSRLSRIYWPVSVVPKDAVVKNQDITSRSQKVYISVLRSFIFKHISQLLLELGLIKSAGNGTFCILPIAERAMSNCAKLVDKHMQSVGAQKIVLPSLTSSHLWEKSGNFSNYFQ